MSTETSGRSRALTKRIVFLLISLVMLYVLWPSLLAVFSTGPELLSLTPAWLAAMLALEAASFASAWALQRFAVRTRSWFGVATAQLAGNAVSRIVPAGAAAGGAVQFRMLATAGIDATAAGTGLAAASLISTATLLALPLLSVPAMIAGRPVPRGLAQTAWLGAGVFVVAFAAGVVLLTTDAWLDRVARAIEWILARLRRRRSEGALPAQLRVARDAIRRDLGRKWWEALLASLGNWLFDYLALLAALTAVGARPRPSLVLLAYVASMVLGMIPLTPGGLGFVEAGLTTLLVLAGITAADAALATLAYRLVSYWLPLPAGLVAAALHRRRYGRGAAPPLREAAGS
ncbi:MAG TPA: lysylphosphatidylglycerol synthase transmembrane domain-containing protein [Actinomycetota bacterium]